MDAGYGADRRKRPDRELYQPSKAVNPKDQPSSDNGGTNRKSDNGRQRNGTKSKKQFHGGQGTKNEKPQAHKGYNDNRNTANEGWDDRQYGREAYNDNEWQQYDEQGVAYDGSGGRGDYDYRQQNKRYQQPYYSERGRGHQEARRIPGNYGNRSKPHEKEDDRPRDPDGFPEVGYFTADSETQKKKKNGKERSRNQSDQNNSFEEVDWNTNVGKAAEEWPGSAENFNDKPETKISAKFEPEIANETQKAQKTSNRREKNERNGKKEKISRPEFHQNEDFDSNAAESGRYRQNRKKEDRNRPQQNWNERQGFSGFDNNQKRGGFEHPKETGNVGRQRNTNSRNYEENYRRDPPGPRSERNLGKDSTMIDDNQSVNRTNRRFRDRGDASQGGKRTMVFHNTAKQAEPTDWKQEYDRYQLDHRSNSPVNQEFKSIVEPSEGIRHSPGPEQNVRRPTPEPSVAAPANVSEKPKTPECIRELRDNKITSWSEEMEKYDREQREKQLHSEQQQQNQRAAGAGMIRLPQPLNKISGTTTKRIRRHDNLEFYNHEAPGHGSGIPPPAQMQMPPPLLQPRIPYMQQQQQYRPVPPGIIQRQRPLFPPPNAYGPPDPLAAGGQNIDILQQLQNAFNGVRNLEGFRACRDQYAPYLQDCLVQSPEYASHYQLEILLWKCVFYQPLEMLKSNGRTGEALEYIKEALKFYEQTCDLLDRQYQLQLGMRLFRLDELFSSTVPMQPPINNRLSKLVIVLLQHCMICLGDLARYETILNADNNFAKARSWYLKAVQLSPKNGRPYHLLAILAQQTQRRFEAVYYFCRSLAAGGSFEASRPLLLQYLHEFTAKFAEFEEERRTEELRLRRLQQERKHGAMHEVWVRPSGRHEKPPSESDLQGRSPTELHRRFQPYIVTMTSFLFQKINMDSVNSICERVCDILGRLLAAHEIPLTCMQLYQSISLILFAANVHLANKSIQATVTLKILLRVLNVLLLRLRQNLASPEANSEKIASSTHLILPALRLGLQFMEKLDVYQMPMRNLYGFIIDSPFWVSLADVCNRLAGFDLEPTAKISHEPGYVPVVLPEDWQACGFTMVFPSQAVPRFIPENRIPPPDVLRLQGVLEFADFVEGSGYPGISYLEEKRQYVAVEVAEDAPPAMRRRVAASDSEDSGVSDTENAAGELSRLRLHERQEKLKQRQLQKEAEAAVKVEVRPRYLVLDTNTCMDYLDELRLLLASNLPHNLAVPIVVIDELRGLVRDPDRSNVAHSVLKFLQENVGVKQENRLFLLTISGEHLYSLQFSQKDAPGMLNDDRILDSCLSLSALTDSSAPLITRLAVLITDDRNLRLKAHAKLQPTCTMPAFMKWAGLS